MSNQINKAIDSLVAAIDKAIQAADCCTLDSDDVSYESEYYDAIFPANGKALLPEELASKLEAIKAKYN